MSKTFDFVKECGVFYLSTINGDAPAARPFGAMMEHEGTLYFCTANKKAVYGQLSANPAIQIIAQKPGTREWVRVTGKAIETSDLSLKQAMLDACPPLVGKYGSNDNPVFALFAIEDMAAQLNTDEGVFDLA